MVLSAVLSCVIIDDELYCVDGQIGCLYKIRLTDWKKQCLGRLKFKWILSRVTDVFLYQDSIWCIPLYAQQIAQYHLDSGEITYYYSDYQKEGRLYTILRDDIFYMMPLKPSGDLVEFHIDKKIFKINEKWRKKIKQKKKKCERFRMAAYDGKTLIITQTSSKQVLKIDFNDMHMAGYTLSVSDNLNGVVWMNGCFCFTAEKDRKIFIWDSKRNTIEEYVEKEQGDRPFLRPVALIDQFILTDGKSQCYFKEGNFSLFQKINGLKNMSETASFYFRTYLWKNKIILPPCCANMFLEIDTRNSIIDGHIMELTLQDTWISLESHFFMDEKVWPLETYMHVVTGNEDIKKSEKNIYGTTIYKKIVGGQKE